MQLARLFLDTFDVPPYRLSGAVYGGPVEPPLGARGARDAVFRPPYDAPPMLPCSLSSPQYPGRVG